MVSSEFNVASRNGRTRRTAAQGEFLDSKHPIDFVIDLLILAVLAVVPFVMGGRGDIGKLVLVVLVVLATLAYSARRIFAGGLRWSWTGTEALLLMGLALGTIQMIPFDTNLLAKASPELTRLLDGREALSLPAWTTISANPQATRGGLSVYIAYVLFFYLLVHRLRSMKDIGRVLRCIACITIAMATIGLLQRFAGNGRFFWVYQHPIRDTYGSLKGTFANPNHFAHFMALGIGCIVWWWLDGISEGRGSQSKDSALSKVLPCGLALVLFASLLSFSRGGCLVIASTLAVSGGMWWGIGRLNWRVLATVLAVGLPACLGLAIYGGGPLASELGSLNEVHDVEEVSNGRQALWSALREGGEKFAWTGSGIGTHRFIYPVYMEEHFEFSFSHGESGYLHLFMELGLPAMVLLLFGIAFVLRWLSEAYRGRMTASCYAAAIAPAVSASLVHSFFDFVWYISGCMVMLIAMLACLVRVIQFEREQAADPAARRRDTHAYPKIAAWVLAGVATLLGAMILKDRLPRALAAPHWDDYVRSSTRITGEESPEEEREQYRIMYRSLAKAIERDPQNPRFRDRLATISLKRFEVEQQFAENSMTLGQIRQAAELSHFKDADALRSWLVRAFGDKAKLLHIAREQAKIATTNCPLSGTPYLHLGELDFLDPERLVGTDNYIRYAAQVRPHDSAVRFALGGVFARQGELGKAIQHWQAAFRREKETRIRIINSVATQVPAAMFIHMFAPDTPDLGRLLVLYRESNKAADANFVAIKYAQALENDARKYRGKASAKIWWIAQSVYADMGNTTRQINAVSKAVDCDPTDVAKRKTLAGLYFLQENYTQALAECEWCMKQDPNDQNIRKLAREASLRRTSIQSARGSLKTSLE